MTDSELMQIVQNHTGAPWFNGRAFVEHSGWYACALKAREVSKSLDAIIELLRSEKRYDLSDQIRTVKQSLDDAVGYVLPEQRLGR